jgi:hypothetical protein
MATKTKLSPDAESVWKARKGHEWTGWADVAAALDTRDPKRICAAWNELRSAGLASGSISTGYIEGQVLED